MEQSASSRGITAGLEGPHDYPADHAEYSIRSGGARLAVMLKTPNSGSGRGVTIRQRTTDDNRALFELFSEDRFQHFGTGMERFKSPQEMQTWLDNLCKHRFEVVAVCLGKVVGFGSLYISDGRHSHVGSVFLGVREKFQGHGIGSALLKALIATADIFIRLKRVQLTVFSDNEVAIHLYRKFGFEIEGRHRCFLRRETGFVDLLTMARIAAP